MENLEEILEELEKQSEYYYGFRLDRPNLKKGQKLEPSWYYNGIETEFYATLNMLHEIQNNFEEKIFNPFLKKELVYYIEPVQGENAYRLYLKRIIDVLEKRASIIKEREGSNSEYKIKFICQLTGTCATREFLWDTDFSEDGYIYYLVKGSNMYDDNDGFGVIIEDAEIVRPLTEAEINSLPKGERNL